MTTVAAPTAPASPADTTEQEPALGPLARALTAVEPARPLGSTATMAETSDSKGNAGGGKADSGPAAPREGAVAHLIRALGTRIARTGTTVKRTHTVTETRATGATSTTASKRDQQHRSNRDAKLADLSSKTAQGKTSQDVQKADTRGPKAASAAKPGGSGQRGTPATKGSTTAPAPASASAVKGKDRAPTAKPSKGEAAGPAVPAQSTRTASAPDPRVPKADPKGLNAKTAAAQAKATDPAPASAKKKGPSADRAPRPAADPAPTATKIRTQPAREAGYRDGTRAATVAGHARAYRDGARDGWDDRTAADKAEGRTMDNTRTRNAARPAVPKMAPASGSTVDLAKTQTPDAKPVRAVEVGEKTVGFTGDDDTRHTLSRGEVRTLRQFERRLASRQAVMNRVAEGSKVTRALAVDMARRASSLAEHAKAVHGGTRVVRALLRLAERAVALQHRAEEIERNASRGAEAVRVLAANANTRHGGIYRAVMDSPLTTPAERQFYQDRQGS